MGTDVRLGTACCLSVMPRGVLLFRLRRDFSKTGLHTLLLHKSLESQDSSLMQEASFFWGQFQ